MSVMKILIAWTTNGDRTPLMLQEPQPRAPVDPRRLRLEDSGFFIEEVFDDQEGIILSKTESAIPFCETQVDINTELLQANFKPACKYVGR